MSYSRRKVLGVIGGGTILAATAATGYAVTRTPRTALDPWTEAGREEEPRRRALSFALLAPNPHNLQPWRVDLSRPGEVILYADTARALPQTDPFSRQITIGLGCFLELMRMAAAEQGYGVEIEPFPEGSNETALDGRPVARAIFRADPATPKEPLFAHALARRSLKEPFDTARTVAPDMLAKLSAAATAGMRFGGTVDAAEVAGLRNVTRKAFMIEFETPRTYKESVDLFRIGHREVDANPDGIDFSGPFFETLSLFGLFTREAALDTSSSVHAAGMDSVVANTDTAMGHVWLVSPANTRNDQLAAGADWLRVNLAATGLGLGFQPLSQALQEFPEMASLYAEIHQRLAPQGGTVQMLARIGYGPVVPPSPRWPLDAKIAGA